MPHAMQKFMLEIVPEFVIDRALMSMLLTLRKAAYKKKAKAA